MFAPIEIPFGCVMLFNVVDLKDGVKIEDVELVLGEMCNIVKNTYGDDKGGFIGGQVFRYSGFVSDEGSVGEAPQDGVAACDPEDQFCDTVGKVAGFSLHAGVAARAHEARSSNCCADTSQDRQCRKSGCR